MSSGRLYTKGIRRIFYSLTYLFLLLCFSAVVLTWVEPFFLVVEFKPPTIKPLIIFNRDLFAKRTHDDKSTKPESSKTPLLFSPTYSPLSKKVLVDPSIITIKLYLFVSLVVHSYDVGTNPSTFFHRLGDMLLP